MRKVVICRERVSKRSWTAASKPTCRDEVQPCRHFSRGAGLRPATPPPRSRSAGVSTARLSGDGRTAIGVARALGHSGQGARKFAAHDGDDARDAVDAPHAARGSVQAARPYRTAHERSLRPGVRAKGSATRHASNAVATTVRRSATPASLRLPSDFARRRDPSRVLIDCGARIVPRPFVQRIIVDRTGLTGNDDLTLEWNPELTDLVGPDAPAGGTPITRLDNPHSRRRRRGVFLRGVAAARFADRRGRVFLCCASAFWAASLSGNS